MPITQSIEELRTRLDHLLKAIERQRACVDAAARDPVASAFAIGYLRILEESLSMLRRSHGDLIDTLQQQTERLQADVPSVAVEQA